MLGVTLLAVLAALALWQVPAWQVSAARDRLQSEEQLTPVERLLLEKELFQAENAARSTLALILGASGLLLGLGIVWRRFEISRELRSHERFASAGVMSLNVPLNVLKRCEHEPVRHMPKERLHMGAQKGLGAA